MKKANPPKSRKGARALRAILGLLSLAIVFAIAADDRDLLRKSAGQPYVFIVMDTSGSMNWTPPCDHKDAMKDADPYDGACTIPCPMDSATCAQACPNQGCIEYDPATAPPPDPTSPGLQPIIVDDSDTTRFTATINGTAVNVNNASSGYRAFVGAYGTQFDTFDDFAWTRPGTSTPDPSTDASHTMGTSNKATYRFTRDLQTAGLYHVYAYWYVRRNDSSNPTSTPLGSAETRVGIEYFDGTATRKRFTEVNQKEGNRFVFLGTFDFKKSGATVPAAVTISNVDEDNNFVVKGEIHADAVAFLPVPKVPAGASCKTTGYRCQQPLCPDGDCYAPAAGDDPSSKFFQAKQAMYEVLTQINDVNFGFASYEQDSPHIMYKHWQYRLPDNQTAVFNFPDGAGQTTPFPEPGRRDIFGTGPPWDLNGRNVTTSDLNFFHCATSETYSTTSTAFNDDHHIGCSMKWPADVSDLWEMERMRILPKLGRGGDITTSAYFRAWTGSEFRIYRVAWIPKSANNDLGDDVLPVDLEVWWCKDITNDADCNSSNTSDAQRVAGPTTVNYRKVGDLVPFNIAIGRYPMTGTSYFDSVVKTNTNYPAGLVTNAGVQADGGRSCNGLEPNFDWNVNVAGYSGFTTVADDDAWGTGGSDYAFKRPWIKDARGDKSVSGATLSTRVTYFDTGDFLPWDWSVDKDNNRNVRNILAPNITRDDSALGTPDFRLATYFHDRTLLPRSTLSVNDNPTNELRRIRLRDDVRLYSNSGTPDNEDDDTYELDVDFPTDTNIPFTQKRRPLFASGSTPIYQSVRNFKDWYNGWKAYAREYDVDWQCRPKYLLFLTDGDETCDTPPANSTNPPFVCDEVRQLSQTGPAEDRVKTYVVGFGLPGGGNALTCMATQGLTDQPLLPRNKTELVDALTDIFNSIRTESFAFASASIPAVQSTAADKIYLSSFTPIQSRSVWPGRLDAFRQPLPLTKDGKPDVTFSCNDPIRESGCHLWDAADRLLAQAPTPSDLSNPPNFKLGMNFTTQRRVLYGQSNPAGQRKALRLMLPPEGYTSPALNADRLDMAEVLLESADYSNYRAIVTSILTTSGQKLAAEQAAQAKLNLVVGQALVIKEEDIPATALTNFSCTGGRVILGPGTSKILCRYVMGDIFHANPSVIIGPSNFSYFKGDLCSPSDYGNTTRANNCGLSPTSTVNRGYREYVARNVWRRRMLISATDDGQLHFFDAGVYTTAEVPKSPSEPNVFVDVDVFTDGKGYEIFSYAPRIAMPAIREQSLGTKHVYSLDGSVAIGDAYIDPVNQPAVATEREWRTILIGGMREAGDVFGQNAHVADLASGYYALDVTQPDQYENNGPDPDRKPIGKDLGVPTCLSLDTTSGKQKTVSGCATLAGKPTVFPLELWTFQDQVRTSSAAYNLDEDGNGVRDLGATWSQPVIGQIAVCKTGNATCNKPADYTTRWVAIFGGGLDAANKTSPKQGTWLYMVDVETGDAIYKRQLIGAAAADPAVIDVDQDGLLDVIYIGTTAGYLYKVDLRKTNGGKLPQVVNVTIPNNRMLNPPLLFAPTVQRITDAAWEPFKILYTGTTVATGDGMPIYYPPAMFKIPERNVYGGLLLVGDRENLWTNMPSTYKSRVYVFVDENYTSDVTILSSQLANLNYKAAVPSTTDYLLYEPPSGKKRGWSMEVPLAWRATGEPFLIAGVAVFSLFDPINLPQIDPDGVKVCRRQGNTRGISLFVKNGNPLGDFGPSIVKDECVDVDDLCCGGRCFKIDEFTTAIHTTSTVTKNRPPEARTDGGSYFGRQEMVVNEAQKAMLDAIRNAIMDTMPSSCQYNEKYEISFAVLRNSTGLNELARIPMMVCPGDWKD